MTKKVLIIFGTRPEAIKMAPVVKILQEDEQFEAVTCVTAQHRQMLDQVLEWFQITPDHDLNLMRPNQTLAGITARAIQGVYDVIEDVKPDVVLVQGDTTTAMSGAMAGFYHRVPVGHIEAGLRTSDIYNPFPEEVNRRLISVMTTYNFAPTEISQKALLDEGADPESVYVTGNTVIDALHWTVERDHKLNIGLPLDEYNERLILITAHRRESFGEDFEAICLALKQITEDNQDVRLIYPVHLNPNVQEPVHRLLNNTERVHLIEPLPYPDFAHLMNLSTLIITDSGGLQEEAPSLGKPVLVMRRTTERPEAIMAGVAKLVGTDKDVIVAEANRLLQDQVAYDAMANSVSPFGDGHSAERIRDILLK